MDGVDLGVLGPFEVRLDGEPRDVGGPRLRTLLAVLAAEAGRVVSVAALGRALWGADAPAHADRTVRTYLSRLRGTVGSGVIVTRPPGYVLHLAPDALDAARFERLAADGRRVLAAGEPAAARERLAGALALWRGHAAYEEFGDVETLAAEGMRLDRLRHNAVQDRIDAELAIGEDTGLIAELEALTTAFPGHERLWAQLMTALYRAGRQSDALAAFRRARHGLITAAGVEPSPVLTQVHRRVLAHDPALLATRATAVAGPAHDDALVAGEHALLDDGDLRTSREHFETAYVRAERAGDAASLARAALGLGGVWVHEHRTAVAAAALLTRLRHALERVDPGSSLGHRLQARLAAELDYEAGTHDRVLAAVSRTRTAGDPVAHAEALSLAHHCLLGPDHAVLRQELATELVGVRSGRRTDLVMGVLWDTVDRFLAGDPHAERRLGELDDLLAERKHLAASFVADALKVMLAIRAGRFREAEAGAQACAELGQAAGDFDALGWYGAQLVAIRWFQGRLGELVPVLDGLMHSPTLSPIDNSYYSALAVAAASAGDRRTAAGALARLCGEDLGALPRSSTWLTSLCGAAETAYLLDDRTTAARIHELLAPYGHLPAMASLGIACFGSVHHQLGTTALTAGDPDRAVTHLRAAVRHNLALAHWPAAVFSRRRHAEALVRRGAPGDAAAAERELAAAEEEARTFTGPPVSGW
ncbi:BTAD domain-containing putative transcriptional regulator [Amycolatopsis sp. lyj-23]|uniref:BTAD domain-containing putative transcriptional regulator n=1 Tax=Amycolatopsis sp. lyj-23 TaxID=2789283 RepID=UPI00397B1FC5